ncbi:polymorphic toxin-type HINT domain-containing protein [Streptomyces mirabilis]|uniref:polymorphic toxin-type HINT domain-containing protein n=1 Tax=Streptomyces mirabilis TaxID=68239 RepID=UPI0036C86AA5
MADGTRRPIKDVRVGDLVLATDPASGKARPEPVTDTFRHDTNHLVDVTLASDGTLTSTTGHRVYSADRGWVRVSDLRVGERLRTADGSLRTVTALNDRVGMAASQRVYGLTVEDLYTFHVRSEGRHAADLLVHNCVNLSDEMDFPGIGCAPPFEARQPLPRGGCRGRPGEPAQGSGPDQHAVDQRRHRAAGRRPGPRPVLFPQRQEECRQTGDAGQLPDPAETVGEQDLARDHRQVGQVRIAGHRVQDERPRAGRGERSACGPEEAPGKKRHVGFIVFDSYPLSK